MAFDVAFESIKFIKDDDVTFAHIPVAVIITDALVGTGTENKVQISVQFPADPKDQTVVAMVKKAPGHIIEQLRSVARHVGTTLAETLLSATTFSEALRFSKVRLDRLSNTGFVTAWLF